MDLPMSDWLTDSFPTRRLPDYRKALQDLAETLDVTYVPAHEFPPFTDADFREQSHMNRAGALKLTQFVGHQLKQHFAVTLKISSLRPAQVPSLRLNESLDAGHRAGQPDAGMSAP
jgi:hypothetical protein